MCVGLYGTATDEMFTLTSRDAGKICWVFICNATATTEIYNLSLHGALPIPTMTTAGSGVKGIDSLLDFSERMSPLGNATADECADYCIVMFSDLTKKVTMQNLMHDGGFSSMGMSLRAIQQYNKSFEDCGK